MKKLFSLLLAALLSSCATFSPVVSFIDYSAYQAEGMFLTEANSPNFEYTPVGSINVLVYSGYVRKTVEDPAKAKIDDIYYNGQSSRSYHNATIETAISELIEKAKSRGANCVVNLKYEYVPSFKGVPEGWFVSGMAAQK